MEKGLGRVFSLMRPFPGLESPLGSYVGDIVRVGGPQARKGGLGERSLGRKGTWGGREHGAEGRFGR